MSRDYTTKDVPQEVENFCEYILDGYLSDSSYEADILTGDMYYILRRVAQSYDTVKVEDGVNSIDWQDDDLNEEYFLNREDAILGDVWYLLEEDSQHPVIEFESNENSGDLHLMYFSVDPENISSVGEQGIPSDFINLESDEYMPDISFHGVTVNTAKEELCIGVLPLSDITPHF